MRILLVESCLLDKQGKPIIIRRCRITKKLRFRATDRLQRRRGSACAGAGIGRQAWLRAMCRKAWGFKSPPAHSEGEQKDGGARPFRLPTPCRRCGTGL